MNHYMVESRFRSGYYIFILYSHRKYNFYQELYNLAFKNCYAQRPFLAKKFPMVWSESLLLVDSMFSSRRFRIGKDFEL